MMKKTERVILLFLLLLCLLGSLGGCTEGGTQADHPVKEATLNEEQQKLADGIWEAKSIWGGCSKLTLIQHGGEYYLTANFLVRESKVNMGDVFGEDGMTTVGTYKEYAYRIVNEKIVDDLSLGDGAGVLSVGKRLKSISFSKNDTITDKKARISQLASYYGR